MRLSRTDIVLVRTEGPLNLGSVARLCGNYGCGLRLVDVQADATSREAMMMAHPSHAILERAPRFPSLREALADVEIALGTSSKIVEARDRPALDVERARGLLPSDSGRVALVFGNERTGLLLEEAALCQRMVRLETPGPAESLNLSHAVAVVLAIFALADRVEADIDTDDDTSREPALERGGVRALKKKRARAGAAAKEALFHEWSGALDSVGYFKTATPTSFAPRLREILDKMDVSERDVELLQGMMRIFGKERS